MSDDPHRQNVSCSTRSLQRRNDVELATVSSRFYFYCILGQVLLADVSLEELAIFACVTDRLEDAPLPLFWL